jgi:hypothetical protein
LRVGVVDRQEIAAELGEIAWRELQRFFASGQAIAVAEDLDLLTVACECAEDNAACFSDWIQAGRIAPVSDEQAREWLAANALMRAVVVKPWVLVQPVLREGFGRA